MAEFWGSEMPPYGILTHTWGLEEVSFADICNPAFDATGKEGYDKIKRCCQYAVGDGLDYVWVDTCCIDKSSSAELSEAINSMYKWYKGSAKCYAHLSDVIYTTEDPSFESSFTRSRWFTRGWTLQELIAPAEVRMFTSTWRYIGSKHDLSQLITRITGIDESSLLTPHMPSVSIARRMSWAAKRETTRIEDKAYCLLGIFGVNMPLLYGEGQMAFIRLQEEIMKDSDDQSLFAWEIPRDIARHGRLWGDSCGILANAPEFFANAADIVPLSREGPRYCMTNKGLEIQFPLLPSEQDDRVVALLECTRNGYIGEYLGITLLQNQENGVYWRTCSQLLEIAAEEAVKAVARTIYISKGFAFQAPSRLAYFTCWVRCISLIEHGFKLAKVFPAHYVWDGKSHTMKIPFTKHLICHRVGLLFCDESNNVAFVVIATIDHHRDQGWVQTVSELGGRSLDDYMRSTSNIRNQIAEEFSSTTPVLHKGERELGFDNEYYLTAEIQSKNIVNPRIWILTIKAEKKGIKSAL